MTILKPWARIEWVGFCLHALAYFVSIFFDRCVHDPLGTSFCDKLKSIATIEPEKDRYLKSSGCFTGEQSNLIGLWLSPRRPTSNRMARSRSWTFFMRHGLRQEHLLLFLVGNEPRLSRSQKSKRAATRSWRKLKPDASETGKDDHSFDSKFWTELEQKQRKCCFAEE